MELLAGVPNLELYISENFRGTFFEIPLEPVVIYWIVLSNNGSERSPKTPIFPGDSSISIPGKLIPGIKPSGSFDCFC